MFNFFHTVAQRGMEIIGVAGAFFAALSQPNIVMVNPPQVLILPATTSTEAIGQIAVPAVATSSLIVAAVEEKKQAASPAKITSPAIPPPPPEKPQQVKLSSIPKIATVQSILDGTSYSLNQRVDGSYWISLRTDTGDGSEFSWGLGDATIGGSASVPAMSASFSCDPEWNPPPMNSPDQNPTFEIKTSYSCNITLTDNLMRAATKKITFQTGSGRLLVKASDLNTLLKSGQDYSGFVFDNQSNDTLIIKGLTFDVYFKALNTSSPIAVRFINPDDETSYADFPVQDLPADAADSKAKSSAGMKTSLSFSVKPHAQRLFSVELLGVQPLTVIGINPEFKITAREINTDNANLKIVFFSPIISWSCIPFDPMKSLNGIPNDQNCH